MTEPFPARGELTMTFWARPSEPIPVGACPDCAAIVAVPDQPAHTHWHLRTGMAIARAASTVAARDAVDERCDGCRDLVEDCDCTCKACGDSVIECACGAGDE